MQQLLLALIACLLISPSARAEEIAASPILVVIPRDTPIDLMAMTEVTTANALPGTAIKLRVYRAVVINGRIVIPVGTPAFGEVVAARGSGALGRTGSMSVRLCHIQLGPVNIPIEGDLAIKGASTRTSRTVIMLTGLSGLFHRGNDAKIKAGEIVAAFVSQDTAIPADRATTGR